MKNPVGSRTGIPVALLGICGWLFLCPGALPQEGLGSEPGGQEDSFLKSWDFPCRTWAWGWARTT